MLKLITSLVERYIKKMNIYKLLKALHLISVISWMAGLLYFKRIFVYHTENGGEKKISDI